MTLLQHLTTMMAQRHFRTWALPFGALTLVAACSFLTPMAHGQAKAWVELEYDNTDPNGGAPWPNANDLTLWFQKGSSPMRESERYERPPADGEGRADLVAPSSAGKTGGQSFVKWDTQTMQDSVPNGGSRTVEWRQRMGHGHAVNWSRIDPEKSHWTFNGAKAGKLRIVAQNPIVRKADDNSMRFIFENPEEFPIAYIDVEVFLNNDIDMFDTADYRTPTGEPFPDVPPIIVLDPGDLVEFVVPADWILPDTYHLVFVKAVGEGQPGPGFHHGAAYAPQEFLPPFTCANNCGGGNDVCFCDDACADFGDCCIDYCETCADAETCAPVPEPCNADLTGDGFVGVGDLLFLLACWGPLDPATDCEPADLTGDGAVGVADLLELLAQWGACQGGEAPLSVCVQGDSNHGPLTTCEECAALFPGNWSWTKNGVKHDPDNPCP